MELQGYVQQIKDLVQKGNYTRAEAVFYVAVADEGRKVFGVGSHAPYSKLQPFVDALDKSGLWGHIAKMKPDTQPIKFVQEIIHNRNSIIPNISGISAETVINILEEANKKGITDRRNMVDVVKEYIPKGQMKRDSRIKEWYEDIYSLAVGKTWQNMPMPKRQDVAMTGVHKEKAVV